MLRDRRLLIALLSLGVVLYLAVLILRGVDPRPSAGVHDLELALEIAVGVGFAALLAGVIVSLRRRGRSARGIRRWLQPLWLAAVIVLVGVLLFKAAR